MIMTSRPSRDTWEILELLRWGKDRNREVKAQYVLPFSSRKMPESVTVQQGQKVPRPDFPPNTPIPHPTDPRGREYSGEERNVYVSVSYRRFNIPPGEKSKDKIKANTHDTIDYLLRFEDKKGFSATEGDLNKDAVHQMLDDDAVFKIIISPEDGSVMNEQYVREVVKEIEKKADKDLKWVAVIHDNTDHPHAHVVISRTDGEGLSWDKPLSLPAEYISKGIREAAKRIATRILGRKPMDVVRHEMQDSVYKDGLSRIDHRIFGYPPRNTGLFTMTDGGYAVLNQDSLSHLPHWLHDAVLKRLEILSNNDALEIGIDRGRYVCYAPYQIKDRLRDIGTLLPFKDVEEEYGEAISIIPSNKPLKEPVSGTVIRTVVVDDNAPTAGFVIRSSDGHLYYVEGEVPYSALDSIGKEVEVVPREAKSERYRTPQVRMKKGGMRR